MSDLELMMVGVVVTFLAVSGAYVAMRHRANEAPVDSYESPAARRAAREARDQPPPPDSEREATEAQARVQGAKAPSRS